MFYTDPMYLIVWKIIKLVVKHYNIRHQYN